jgi:chaperonin GroES
MQLHPLADRIVARQVEAASKTASGILLPDSAKEKPQLAEVTAVGKEVKEVKVGDKVLYKQFKADEVKVGADTLLLMSEEDVMAVAKD